MITEKNKYNGPASQNDRNGKGPLTWDYLRRGFDTAEKFSKTYSEMTPEEREERIAWLLSEDKDKAAA